MLGHIIMTVCTTAFDSRGNAYMLMLLPRIYLFFHTNSTRSFNSISAFFFSLVESSSLREAAVVK